MENTIEIGPARQSGSNTYYDIVVNGEKVLAVMHDTEEGFVDIVRPDVRGIDGQIDWAKSLLSLPVTIPGLQPDVEPPLTQSW